MTLEKRTKKGTRKKKRGGTKRQRLVSAAAECFREGGIRATTIKIIAERADVPIGNVYYYFKTKEDFAVAVVAAFSDAQANDHARWSAMDPKEALESFVHTSLSTPGALSRHGGGLETLIHDLARESSSALDRARALVRAEEEFVGLCFSTLEENSESPERARRLARWLVTLVRGARIHAHVTGDPRLVAPMRADVLRRLKARVR